MCKRSKYWAIAYTLLLAVWLPGQAEVAATPQLRLLTPADGLPSTDIFGLGQDRDGYLWIATMDGLARYDGVEMDIWRHDPDDPTSLPDNRLQSLHIDADDRIWVGTVTGGAAMLDRARHTFVRYDSERFPALRSSLVTAIATEPGAVWLGTVDGLYRIATEVNADDDDIRLFLHSSDDSDSLPGRIVFNMARDAHGTLWVATSGGLARIDAGQLRRVQLPGPAPSPAVYSAIPQGTQLWVGSAGGMFVGTGDGRWERPVWSDTFLYPNAVITSVVDPAGGLWLGSQRGVWRVSAEGTPIPVPPTVDAINMRVLTLLMQRDGALWMPIFGQGLGYLRSDWRRLIQFVPGSPALTGDRYRSLTLAKNNGIWMLARNGAVERMHRTGVVEHLDARITAQLKAVRPVALALDDNDVFWFAAPDNVLRVHREGRVERWSRDATHDAALPGLNHMLAVAPGQKLWIGNSIGLQLRDTRTGQVLGNFLADEYRHSGFALNDLEQLEIGPDGRLWIAGVDGLVRFDADRGIEGETGLRGQRVLAFRFDGLSALWLFRNHQLQRFEQRDGDWQQIHTVGIADGLPALNVGGLRVDFRHRVWLSSPRGLYCWDPVSARLQQVGIQNGLHNQEFVEGALALDADGILVGATIDGGVVAIDTHLPDPPARTPTLHLKQVAVWHGGQWLVRDVSQGQLVLAHDESEFRINLRVLDYDDPVLSHYWSRLDGHDTDWVDQGHQGDRVFSGIPPGRYQLHLRAVDAAGNPTDAPSLTVSIDPPWWNSAGFRLLWLLLGLTLVMVLAALYRRYLHRRHAWQLARAERELAERASLAKTRFLATLGHEVRTPMTGVLGMSELLIDTELTPEQRGYAQSIHNAGQHLLRLVNDALDLSRIEADRLELERQPFDLHQMLAEVVALESPLAQARGLGFEHVVAPDVPHWLCGDAGRVRQIVLNLIGNAIKFTEHGSVNLHVEALIPAGIRLIIADTGPGLNAEQTQRLFRRFEQADGAHTSARYGGSGLGLAISQELAAAMGGRIDVESTPGEGTCFIVTLPLPSTQAPAIPDWDRPVTEVGIRPTLHLLLVEDDTTVAAVITGLLRAQGHTVVHTSHGLAALAEITRQTFDLALLDLDLPGIDGLRLAQLLREQGFKPPLIALTARSDAAAEPAAQAAGFVQFLRKPATSAMLVEVIERAQSINGHHSSSM